MTPQTTPAFPSDPPGRQPQSRTPWLIVGGAGLTALGVTAGLLLRPAPEPGTPATAQTTAAQTAPAQPPAAQPAPAVGAAPQTAQPAPQAAPRQPVQTTTASHGHSSTQAMQQRSARTAPASRSADEGPREPARRVATCSDCGVIESVRTVRVPAQPTGIGAVAGGVIGGVLGNQVGGGSGRTAMTVLGAVGGGAAGHEIEKRTRGETVYDVRIRMDDGSVRTVQQRSAPAAGARVRVDGNTLRSAAGADEPRYVRTGQAN